MANPVALPGLNDANPVRQNTAIRQISERLEADYAPLASPVFTGDPQAPTPALADNDTSIATTAYVQGQNYTTKTYVDAANATQDTAIAGKAATVHTHAQSDVTGLVAALAAKADTTALASYATLASPALTGSPTAPTQSSGDNSTKLATTAYADAAAPWKLVKKTSAQSVTTNAFVDDSSLTFAMLANTTYAVRVMLSWVSTSGGLSVSANGPASPTLVQISFNGGVAVTAYNSQIIATTALAAYVAPVSIMVQNGSNAGNLVVRIATGSVTGTTTVQKGSYLEYTVIA